MKKISNFAPPVEQGEEWRKVYSDIFEVSNLGRVRRKGKILNLYEAHDGYIYSCLWENNKGRHRRVHRLVAEAFIPNTNTLPVVDHIDGNRRNNRVENLRWLTNEDNSRHRANPEGTYPGIPPTISDKKIHLMLEVMSSRYLSNKDAGELFGVSKDYIQLLKTKKHRKDISEKYDCIVGARNGGEKKPRQTFTRADVERAVETCLHKLHRKFYMSADDIDYAKKEAMKAAESSDEDMTSKGGDEK